MSRIASPCVLAFALGLAAAAAARAAAPDPGAMVPRAERAGATPPADAAPLADPPCETGPISVIFVDNRSIFDTTDPSLDTRFLPVYQLANRLHFTTGDAVIRRELLFREGDCYDPAILAESERLLRNFDFLASVDIFALRQDDGTYHVVVDTQDEWSTRPNVRIGVRDRRPYLKGARLRESNLIGTGQAVEVFYLEDEELREYGIQYATRQFAGTRLDFRARLARTRAGTAVDQVLEYPFVGEYGRWAARQAFQAREDEFAYVVDGEGALRLLVPVRRVAGELVALRRFGQPGHLLMFGGGITFRTLRYIGPPSEALASDYGSREDGDATRVEEIAPQRRPVEDVRAVVMIGVRRVEWVRRRGLDSMRGQQDVALGRQVQLTLGRSIPGLGRDEALFASLSAGAATEAGPLLVSAQLWTEARRDLRSDAPGWEDVTADAELGAYLRLGAPSSHTLVFHATGTGAWHTRAPFQLTLGGTGGLHGYATGRFPGGRRVVASLEDRIYFGSVLGGLADLGGTVFVDAGRVWAGDAPFGRDSGWRASVGVGVRGAFPAGSRSTYRVDFSVPVEHGPDGRGLRVTLTMSAGRGLGVGATGYAARVAAARYEDPSSEFLRLPD